MWVLREGKGEGRLKLVSVMTRNFTPGLVALAHSLSKYGKVNELDWHIIWEDEPVENYEKVLSTFKFNAVTHRVSDFDDIPPVIGTKNHLQVTRNKLLAWLLPPDDLYTQIDVDMICKRDAREMLNFKHFSAERRPGAPGFCSGLWTFKPSEDVFHTLITEILPKGWDLADQSILNEYFTEEHPDIKYLDWKWNTSKRETVRQSNWLDLFQDAIFIHYHGKHKPWLANEPGYELTHSLWHMIYREAAISS